MSSTIVRPGSARVACGGLLLAAGLVLGALPALAQSAVDEKPPALPGLRGGVADPGGDPNAGPGGTVRLGEPDDTQFGTGPVDGAAATDGAAAAGGAAPGSETGADGQPAPVRPPKFALPKSQAKTKDRTRIPRLGAPKLPLLQAYPTSARPKGGGATIDTLDTQTLPSPTVAALPLELKLRPRVGDDGFDPPGWQVGSLRLTPYVTQSLGYDSNPDQTQVGIRPSAVSRTEGGLGLISQWSSNELRADLRGGYNDYFSDPGANRPDANGTIDYRFDAARDTVLDAEQRFSIDTQRPGSPELNVAAVGRPLITTFGETLGGTQTFGRFALALHGTFDRTAYDNAELSDGTTQDLANENFNDYGLHLRGSYEITPVFKPFVDVLADYRQHDATVDLSGFRRDSDGIIGQVGTSFEINRLISGEMSGGYGNRSYDDPRLKDIDGPVVNGNVAYAITPLTTLTVRAATTFDETNYAGAAGSLGRSAEFDVTHQLLRNLTLTGSLSYLNTQYIGAAITENTWSESLKAEYHLSRSLVATATYNHERLDSNAVGSSFSQNVVLFGLRLQR